MADVESFRNLADDQLHKVMSTQLKDLDDADLSKLEHCVNLKKIDVSGLMLLFSNARKLNLCSLRLTNEES